MLLRDYLNEFELDWAQAAARSEQIPPGKIKKKKLLLIGSQNLLQRAIALSFLAWNDSAKAGILAQSAVAEAGALMPDQVWSEEEFPPSKADYIIFTGYCCQEMTLSVGETARFLTQFKEQVRLACASSCQKMLLLSDGRVYGKTGYGFAASEYESGKTDTAKAGFEAQYLLGAMEHIFVTEARKQNKNFVILRSALLYGAGIPAMNHAALQLSALCAAGKEFSVALSRKKSSYISIHDLLTAIQYVLTVCPDNKIFNVAGPDSVASKGEIAMKLYQNFPDLCKLSMSTRTDGEPVTEETIDGIWLNTQLLEHYGFIPTVSLEDGLIILVKYLQNTGEAFIFDNTYMGKLEKVQQILLAYLLEIDRICKKHDIKYFPAGGTLLGAIRHH